MNEWLNSKSSMGFFNKDTINGLIKVDCKKWLIKLSNKAARLISQLKNVYINESILFLISIHF